MVRSLALGNLKPEESRAFLAARQIPTEQHRPILDFTQGYPLALSLVAEVVANQGTLPGGTLATPDLVQALVRRFLDDMPTAAHREALEACALLRVTTEPILAAMLGPGRDLYPLFEWLAGLSFMDHGPVGLFPHDLARDALIADLRWRNPERYADLHRRAREYFATRLREAPPAEQQRILWDYIFLHRENPVVRGAFTWQDTVSAFADTAR